MALDLETPGFKAEASDAEAQFQLGDRLLNGKDGVAKDERAAVHWFRAAAQQGHANGQHFLAWCLLHGSGVDMNKEVAVELFRKAADSGLARAQLAGLLPPERFRRR